MPDIPEGFTLEDDPQWYKDAIIYELHVRAFYDSNDDGIGDFVGLTEKLDYLQDLGVNAVWLLPFYPSPRCTRITARWPISRPSFKKPTGAASA